MNNDYIMRILLTYDNLQGLEYKDNTLFLGDDSVSLKDINLAEHFNKYSQLYADQYIINAQDFFNIMKIHSKKFVAKKKN